MIFLTDADIERQIKADILSQLTGGDSGMLNEAERVALTELSSYISGRFEITALIGNAPLWDVLIQYTPDNVVHVVDVALTAPENKKFYRVRKLPNDTITDVDKPPVGTAVTNAGYWEFVAQGRDPWLVTLVVDMMLYHLHSRVAPRQIPELRMDRYDKANEQLKAIASAKMNPGFVLPSNVMAWPYKQTNEERVGQMLYGSNQKQTFDY